MFVPRKNTGQPHIVLGKSRPVVARWTTMFENVLSSPAQSYKTAMTPVITPAPLQD